MIASPLKEETAPPPERTESHSKQQTQSDSRFSIRQENPFNTAAGIAERKADMLIATWCERGRKGCELDPALFPTPRHRQIATIVADAVDQGVRSWINLMPLVMHDEQLRLAFHDAVAESALTPSTESAKALADDLLDFHVQKSEMEIGQEIAKRIESGDDWQDLRQKLEALNALQQAGNQPFPLTRACDIPGCTEAADFVEGLLTEGGASVVYGPSNCGKSFWTLDLAACVATGRPFRDEIEVDQGAVVYVALEGIHGTRNRLEALRQAGHLPEGSPLFLCFDSVSLLEPGHAPRLAATVSQAASESALPCRLVILDTLSRAMAGGDENSGQDMTKAVSAIDEVKAATGAHVMVIHHCGKDEARGARGHSSLRAAVDTEIEVSRPEGQSVSTVRVTKQRDMQPCEPMPFSLASVTLGTSRRGKPITSCTVHHEDSIMANTSKAGRKPEVPPDALLNLLPQPGTAAWQKAADTEMGVSKSAFYRALEKLKQSKSAKQSTGGSWDR